MDAFYQTLNLVCSGFVLLLMFVVVITYRKQRRFKPLILLISAVLSLLILVAYVPITGIEINFVIAAVFFSVGLLFGGISGITATLSKQEDVVFGRFSRISFVLWCLSLILTMLMNRSSSAIGSALALLPFCLTTGMQFSSNLILSLRTMLLKRKQPAAL